jgi:glycosyltransferase involved in cell wall biosynthesis
MRVALLTLAVPIPGRPSVGLYNIAHEARIITCAPSLPRWSASLSLACSRHILRPYKTLYGDVEVRTARVPMVYSKSMREKWTTKAPELVQYLFTLAVQRALRSELHDYQPDVVVIHGIYPWSDLAIKYANSTGTRVIAIEHSGSDIERIVRNDRLRSGYVRRASQLGRVFAVNSKMVQSLRDIQVQNIKHIHNGITRVKLDEDDAEPPQQFTVLCAGSYIQRKGHAQLINAFAAANIKHAKLRLIGQPTPEILSQINQLGIRDHIEILPEMTQAQLRQEMKRADLFALPSEAEAFGLVFAESLSVGTPVLLGDDAGVLNLPYVRNCSWVVPPKDSVAIRNALVEAANMSCPIKLRELKFAREWIATQLTWENNARTLLDVG